MKSPKKSSSMVAAATQEKGDDSIEDLICKRIGLSRAVATDIGDGMVNWINDAREIGILVKESWEKLPGKQMTLDFFQKERSKYVDQFGMPINLDTLKWFVKVSVVEKKPIKDVVCAMSYRKELTALLGLEFEGEAPPKSGEATTNYFVLFLNQTPRLLKILQMQIDGIEKDARFGKIEGWPRERAKIVLEKILPLAGIVEGLKSRLEKIVK